MESKKKKIIIGLLVALAVIAITLVLLNEWGNREHEKMLEATKLEQELEEKALKEQQEQRKQQEQEEKELEEQVETGEGTDVLQGLIQTDPETNQNNQSSNNNNSNANQNNSNKNNNNSNNSTPSQPSQEGNSSNKSDEEAAKDFAEQFGGTTGPTGDPDDNRIVEDDDEIFG